MSTGIAGGSSKAKEGESAAGVSAFGGAMACSSVSFKAESGNTGFSVAVFAGRSAAPLFDRSSPQDAAKNDTKAIAVTKFREHPIRNKIGMRIADDSELKLFKA
ncbi:MAG: hypothetical protein ABR574_10420 [Cryomorphaceae bacterium]|nr:hypothetical protein [Flavobacteriales bacterium]